MSRFADLPIRRKISLVVLGTCAVAVLLACFALAAYEMLDSRRASERDAVVLADTLGANATAALAFDDVEAARSLMRTLEADPDVSEARLTRDQQPFVGYCQGQGARALKPTEPPMSHARGSLLVSRPVVLDGRPLGTITLRITTATINRRLALLTGVALVTLCGALLVAWVLSSRLQRPISEPILELAHAARAVAEHTDYSVRVAPRGRDEIGLLTVSFNDMLGQIARHADSLAATNAELEQFAYITSHDLKEPLRMVTLYMGILDRQLGNELSERHRQFLQFAVQGAQRMQTLINDLLAFTRTSHITENHQLVDLVGVVQEVLHTFQMEIDAAQAVIDVGPLPTIECERTKIVLVFQNLIGNALKFRVPGRPPRITIRSRPVGEEWEISIADNGIGIAPAYQQQIFAVFQRLHNRDTYPGNGIGLAICRKIIEQHRGRIWVRSREGAGATFFLQLPARQLPPPAGLGQTTPPAATATPPSSPPSSPPGPSPGPRDHGHAAGPQVPPGAGGATPQPS